MLNTPIPTKYAITIVLAIAIAVGAILLVVINAPLPPPPVSITIPAPTVTTPPPANTNNLWPSTSVINGNVTVSFIYPPSWQLYSGSLNEKVLDSPATVAAVTAGDRETSPDIVIQLLDNPAGLSVSDFAANGGEGWYFDYDRKTTMTIGGHEVVLFNDTAVSPPQQQNLGAFVGTEDKILVILSAGQNLDTFNLVLNSLN